jgi:hypothetical protein
LNFKDLQRPFFVDPPQLFIDAWPIMESWQATLTT